MSGFLTVQTQGFGEKGAEKDLHKPRDYMYQYTPSISFFPHSNLSPFPPYNNTPKGRNLEESIRIKIFLKESIPLKK